MGRKMLDVMGRKVDLLEKVDVIEHEELKLLGDGVERGVERKDRLVFTSPSDWAPELNPALPPCFALLVSARTPRPAALRVVWDTNRDTNAAAAPLRLS